MDTQHGKQPCNRTDYTDGAAQREFTAFVQTNLDTLDGKYHKAALDPHSAKPLVEQIGEDLCSPSEEIREIASNARSYVCPVLGGHLIDCLDKRETHYEGWRHENGKDQRFVNEGMDCFSELYITSVKEGRTNDEDAALQMQHRADIGDTLHNLPERYSTIEQASGFTKPWFDLIDEDFSNPKQEVRKIAWLAFDYSYISRFEDEMNKKGIQHIYDNCYRRLVNEGAFTQPRKHNNARVYFKKALENAEINEKTRHVDTQLLNDEEWESKFEEFTTFSAEEEALQNISESLLYNEIIKLGYLTEREYQLYHAIYEEGWTYQELAKQQGVSSGAIRQALSEIHRRMILRRDTCIAVKIAEWKYHFYDKDDIYFWKKYGLFHCPHPVQKPLDFTDHADFFIERVEETMKPTLRASATLDSSKPVFLPLTSGIGRRPGRLYIYNGSEAEGQARLCNYLLSQGIDPTNYYLLSFKLRRHGRKYRLPGFPILDEITRHVWEHGSNLSAYNVPKLGLLTFEKNANIQLGFRDFGDLAVDVVAYLRQPRSYRAKINGYGYLLHSPCPCSTK